MFSLENKGVYVYIILVFIRVVILGIYKQLKDHQQQQEQQYNKKKETRRK